MPSMVLEWAGNFVADGGLYTFFKMGYTSVRSCYRWCIIGLKQVLTPKPHNNDFRFIILSFMLEIIKCFNRLNKTVHFPLFHYKCVYRDQNEHGAKKFPP